MDSDTNTPSGGGGSKDSEKRASGSPEQFFKEMKGFFAGIGNEKLSKKGSRRNSLLGPWIKKKSSSQASLSSTASSQSRRLSDAGDNTEEPVPAARRSSSSGRAALRSNRIMSSRYWGGQYRVCTDPSVLRKQLSEDSDGDYVKNEVIGRVPIRAWIAIIGYSDITTKARIKVVSRALREVADHSILKQLESIATLDGERNLLEVISHPDKSCAEDLWLLQFFDPIQIELQKRSLATAQLLLELSSCVCIEDVVLVLKAMREHSEINFSIKTFHQAITEVKKNFDALGRDEWRVNVQPVLGAVVHDCRFIARRPPRPLELFESIENSQMKGNIFKKKEEVKCNGSVWDGHDSEFMFTYFEGGSGELWHWPSSNKKAKLVSSMKLSNQRPTGAAMGQTTRRCIAYGAQFQSTISVMRAHNSDWTRVSKALDASKTSSLVEVTTLTGHEGYVSSVQFFAQDRYLVSGSGDSSVKVWDLERKHIVRNITSAHRADVLCVSTSKLANHVFLTAGAEGTVIFHDHRVEQPLFSVGKFTSDVGAIKFHQNGMKVIAGSFDGSCCIFDSRKPGPELCEYTVPGVVLGCDFFCNMGDSDEAVIIAEESSIQVVYDRPDVDSYVLDLHSDRITSVNSSLDSRLAVSSWDGATSIWMS